MWESNVKDPWNRQRMIISYKYCCMTDFKNMWFQNMYSTYLQFYIVFLFRKTQNFVQDHPESRSSRIIPWNQLIYWWTIYERLNSKLISRNVFMVEQILPLIELLTFWFDEFFSNIADVVWSRLGIFTTRRQSSHFFLWMMCKIISCHRRTFYGFLKLAS